MSTEQLVLTADRAQAQGATARGQQRQTIFWVALGCAALAHAMLIFGVAFSHPRTVGDPNGDSKAIDVELVDSSELSMGNGAIAPPPSQPPTPTQQPQPEQKPQPEPEKQLEPEKQAEAQKQPEPQPQEAKEPTPPDKEEPDPTAVPAPSLSIAPTPEPELPESKEPAKSQPKAAPKAETKPAPKAVAKSHPPKTVDLSVPYNLAMQGSSGDEGGASSASRPPGITRSGENDRFGRDVIRALKKTMPPSYGTRTRITIRIILDGNGNVGQLTLVNSGGKNDLDQDILFSARQAAYPFPPKNASVADRTFLVTYVYK
jgi:protein TonB